MYLESASADRVNPGVTATALAAVNAVPAVVDAAPGILGSPVAGPGIVSRQSRRDPREDATS